MRWITQYPKILPRRWKSTMIAFLLSQQYPNGRLFNSAASFFKKLSLSPLMDMGTYVSSQPIRFFFLLEHFFFLRSTFKIQFSTGCVAFLTYINPENDWVTNIIHQWIGPLKSIHLKAQILSQASNEFDAWLKIWTFRHTNVSLIRYSDAAYWCFTTEERSCCCQVC